MHVVSMASSIVLALIVVGVLTLFHVKPSSCSIRLRGCTKGCDILDSKAPEDYNFSCENQPEETVDNDCGTAQYLNSTLSCCCGCPNGTFMGKRNRCAYCRPHTKCAPNEEVESIGSSTTDTKCRCRSFPIPWEEVTTRSTEKSETSGDADTSTVQPSTSSMPDQPVNSPQCVGNWPKSAVAVCVILGFFCIGLIIIIICKFKQLCCFKSDDVPASNQGQGANESEREQLRRN